MLDTFHIVRLSAEQVRERAEQLSEVLSDCVTGGASVSFMPPFGPGDAKPFWLATAESCEAGHRIVLADIMDSMAVGSVQLLPVGLHRRQDGGAIQDGLNVVTAQVVFNQFQRVG